MGNVALLITMRNAENFLSANFKARPDFRDIDSGGRNSY
jgi:hypothetical protein